MTLLFCLLCVCDSEIFHRILHIQFYFLSHQQQHNNGHLVDHPHNHQFKACPSAAEAATVAAGGGTPASTINNNNSSL